MNNLLKTLNDYKNKIVLESHKCFPNNDYSFIDEVELASSTKVNKEIESLQEDKIVASNNTKHVE